MAEQLPITPALLIWARKRAGITIEEAVAKFPRFADWEAGKAAPTYPQLEALSDALKIPVAVFFFPEPPAVPAIKETFRTLPDAEFESLPRGVRLLLRKAKALQLNLAELTAPSRNLITQAVRIESTISPEELAVIVRAYLNIPIATQVRWGESDTAFKNWRKALFDVGVFVFKDAFRNADFSGFCLSDEQFPIIYVNNSTTHTRQIFTLFHELAHLLLHTSGVDTLDDPLLPKLADEAKRIEILCNRFAAEFLLPTDVINAEIADKKPTEELAEALAAKYVVSREVIFRKFLDRGLISKGQYDAAVKKWNAQRQKDREPGGDHYWNKLAYLGYEYVGLVLGQYHQNRIDEEQLSEYLDTKSRNIPKLEEYFERAGA